jgi:UDP-N-acetylmuramate--alanine ligase
MSNLVRYFLVQGKPCAGYDRTPTPLTDMLTKEGAQLHFVDAPDLIPADFRAPATTLVVYTPAIPADHKELQYFQKEGFRLVKRAELLGIITRSSQALCIAGTHGKTTTSTMTAHLLAASHVGCTAFLGGISKNYHSNLILCSHDTDITVIEADEYDRSFHHLSPWMAVITAVDADHLDIYGTHEAYLESFRHFCTLIKEGGVLLLHHSVVLATRAVCPNGLLTDSLPDGVRVYTYGRDEGDFHAERVRIGEGKIVFDLIDGGGRIVCADTALGVPVSINIDNGIAAMALALLAGATPDEVRVGMASYAGVERRFDFYIHTPDRALVCDYAHHPAELTACIRSMRELYGRPLRIGGIFQPHLYSRTRDFYQEFADALSELDTCVLTDLYPARELPIEGVSSRLIYDALPPEMDKHLTSKEDLLSLLQDMEMPERADVWLVLGAGDIDTLMPQISQLMSR